MGIGKNFTNEQFMEGFLVKIVLEKRHLSRNHSLAAYIVRYTEHLGLTELSRKLQRDLSGLSQVASGLDKK